MSDFVIYHFPRDDGFCAAWIARQKWPAVDLVPMNYGQPLPDRDWSGKNILIADFSLPHALMRDVFGAAGCRAKILDHHKSAAADLAPSGYSLSMHTIRDESGCGHPRAFRHGIVGRDANLAVCQWRSAAATARFLC